MNNGIEKVRAKFRVNSILRHRGSCRGEDGQYVSCELQTVKMGAVVSSANTPEDNTFAAATPAAICELSITRPDVVGFFDLDTDYYADFTRATSPNVAATVDHLMRNTVKGSDFAPKS